LGVVYAANKGKKVNILLTFPFLQQHNHVKQKNAFFPPIAITRPFNGPHVYTSVAFY
jgi:hypothetical protein